VPCLPYHSCCAHLTKLLFPVLLAWMGILLPATSLGLAQKYDTPLDQKHPVPGQYENGDTFMRSITPGLTNITPFSTVTYTGTVKLQARTNHSGIALYLIDGPCASLKPPPAITTMPAAITNRRGQFTITLTETEGERCLLARHPNYLLAQRLLSAQSDLGLIVLPAGDMNQDSQINILDLSLISKKYNKANQGTDLNRDGRIDLIDLAVAAYNFSREGPVEWPLPGVGSGNFSWPASGDISNGFYRYHPALDIAAHFGAPILAADAGHVVVAGWDHYYGYHLIIDHGNDYQTLYAHLQSYYVEVGNNVSKGMNIGEMGSTGNSSGPHLHFEIRQGQTRRNPYNFLP
jgi:hypothetical protein